MNVNLLFNKMFWEDMYYNIKWGLWALRKYFRVVWGMRDYDYHYNLHMMKFQLELLCERIEFRGNEVEEDRMKKVKDMRRVIELINNVLEDNFAERCGYDHNYKIKLVKCEDNSEFFELVTTETVEQKEVNSKALNKSFKLQEDEWNELWDIIKKGRVADCGMQGWWD